MTELGFTTQLVCLMPVGYRLPFSELLILRQWRYIEDGVRKHFPEGYGLNHLETLIQPHSTSQEFSPSFSSKVIF